MGNLVDSSVWVALFLGFDTQHKKAARCVAKLKGKTYLPYCVLSEVVAILAYKHSKEQADNFIAFAENNRDIEWVNDDSAQEAAFYKILRARVSFADAALLFLSRALRANLVTFDKQLERLKKSL